MKMKNKFSLRSMIVIIVLVIVVFMGGMYFGGHSTPAKEEITSTALTQKIRSLRENKWVKIIHLFLLLL